MSLGWFGRRAAHDRDASRKVEFEDMASVDDLPEGTLLAVEKRSGEKICLFNDRGRIGAVSDRCTHQEFPMSVGTLTERGTLECAWHGAEFECHTGKVLRCPATEPLPVYDVRVEGGRVLVGGVKR